ncbi:hypothetical protein JOF53_000590 [Crossiella equi]|uniref:Uncharacterized protein n=1 Tax=Crossiella equi TaxID=130796 RepID=A0ABS5A548_9PSEU|nr:hypothetical protein [Crossiella equi]MBP2471718.1 hypothetical protein [Crossiella equi]
MDVHNGHGGQRTLLYLMSGNRGGVAVRQEVGRGGSRVAGTLELPGLAASAVLPLVRSLAQATDPRAGLAEPERSERLTDALGRTGEAVWEPVLAEWPDLTGTRVELSPIGDVLALPLHTARYRGLPVCTVLDLAAPPHGGSPPAGPPSEELWEGLRDPAAQRVTCHGILDAERPWRSSVLLGRRLGTPLVVLSAGRLSAFEALPVVGALWPLPDPAATAALLADLHRALVRTPGADSLGDVVGTAFRHGLQVAVWGAFVHFGA